MLSPPDCTRRSILPIISTRTVRAYVLGNLARFVAAANIERLRRNNLFESD